MSLDVAGPSLTGLSQADAAARLRQDGPNALPSPESRGFLRVFASVLSEPMFALLLVAGGVYLALGEPRDAAVLIAFASLSVGIAVIQELRSERVLEALRDLSSPTALVVRDGDRRRIAARDLVLGDLIVVSEGDRVPADAVLLQGADIQTDESLLTGESMPVDKTVSRPIPPLARPGPASGASIFASTLLVRGQALARVAATGPATEVGRIGRALQAIKPEPTALTREIRRIVRILGVVAVAVCASVILLLGVRDGAWLAGVLAGVALAMAMIPEEFPLVLTVFMVMGAWRISRQGVLTRKSSAIETLGSATVLCTDKTGTLTLNRMSVVTGWREGRFLQDGDATGADDMARLIRIGVLASAANPFDPMERALHDGGGAPAVAEGLTARRIYGLTPELLAVTQVWSGPQGGPWLVAAKGAPETIAEMCGLSEADRAAVIAAAEDLAAKGVRVLGVAEGDFAGGEPPQTPRAFDLRFAGLIGLADPLRADVPEAVEACRAAGMRVVMVTGDLAATALSIAAQAGLDGARVMTGPQVAALSDEDLAGRASSITIFARILPEQKLRIVRALQAAGEVVAMTGDGVNDAPALKAADIGVAMGERGSDVAREAAALVLLKDGFAAIVATIRLGRRIYDNLRNAAGFILAVHIPIAGLALFPLMTGGGLVLGPVHIAFLEMIIDPVCSIVFEAEPEADDLMRRPPRDPKAPLLTVSRVAFSLAQGGIGLIAVLAVYLFDRARGVPPDGIRASAFTALVLVDIALIFANRASAPTIRAALLRPNAWLWSLVSATLALLLAGLCLPAARSLLQFGANDAPGMAAAVLAALSAGLAFMGMQRFRRSPAGRGPAPAAAHPSAPQRRSF